MAKVSIKLPTMTKGAEVEIAGLGLFENGKTVSVTQEQVDTWCAVNGREWPEGGTLSVPDVPVEDPQDEAPADGDKKEGKP